MVWMILMDRIKKIDKNYFLIFFFCLFLCFLIVPGGCLFGSNVDWVSQHIVYPDYFRKLFYKTGNLFPNFALSLGAGQNIYNFSYYGLFSPYILLSYLFPFVKMSTYLICLNIILYIVTGFLLYYFFKSKYKRDVSLVGVILLLCASPLLFHLHRHVMFVNYFPFLVLGFIGVDKYFSDKKRWILCFSVFNICLISYYYAICCILVLSIYFIYVYLKNYKLSLKCLFVEFIRFCFIILIGISMSIFLLLPTFYVLVNGRGDKALIDIYSLLLPKFNIDSLLYSNYSMGLTSISFIGLIYFLFSKKRENKFLSFIILIIICIPVFIFILNGGLYIRNKILIPFIILMGVVVCNFLELLLCKKIDNKKLFLLVIFSIIISLFCKYYNVFFYIDICITYLFVYLFNKDYIGRRFLFSGIILICISVLIYSNSFDLYTKKSDIYISKNTIKNMNDILDNDKDIVRFNYLSNNLFDVNNIYVDGFNRTSLYGSISNSYYQKFYREIFNNNFSYRNKFVMSDSNNILFQTFMGVKYLYSSKNVGIGYRKIGNNIYENDNVLPVFYGSRRLVDNNKLKKYKYPYNILYLLNYDFSLLEKINLDYDVLNSKNLTISHDSYLKINSRNNGKLQLKINNDLKDSILLVDFKVLNNQSCSIGDKKITINGISNVLTCREAIYKNNNRTFHYVISSNDDLNKLNIRFNKGKYKISDINIYKLKYLPDTNSFISKFVINKNLSTGDNIIGKINMDYDGYFISSIPYDKGFNIYVDDKKTNGMMVNGGFLGFKLSKGSHNIKIVYSSPFRLLGFLISLVGFLIFILVFINDKNRKKVDFLVHNV